MDLKMGTQDFRDVRIPLLWGTRAVLQDRRGKLSIIDLGRDKAKIEILANKPAPGVEFRPLFDGVKILDHGRELYEFSPRSGRLLSLSLDLPECEVNEFGIRIGSNVFQNNMVSGSGVGVIVDKNGVGVGAPLPVGLAPLVV